MRNLLRSITFPLTDLLSEIIKPAGAVVPEQQYQSEYSPDAVISHLSRYIILHELCHTVYKNHQKAFGSCWISDWRKGEINGQGAEWI
jgi:hypothetical protein